VATAFTRATIARFREDAIRPNAGLRVHAPEEAVVTRLHRFIVRRRDELPFPPQRWTKVRMADIETCFTAMNHD
jgi:hypothetical protein